jgi:hypothetical protein
MQGRERSTTLSSRGNADLVAKIVLDLNILKERGLFGPER